MSRDYKIKNHVIKNEWIMVFSRFGRQIWTKTSVNVRKKHRCKVCDKIVEKERMYRPLNNPMNRWDRICIKYGDLPE